MHVLGQGGEGCGSSWAAGAGLRAKTEKVRVSPFYFLFSFYSKDIFKSIFKSI